MTAPLAQLLPVEDIRPGDVLRHPSGATNVSLRVAGPYEDGTRVVIYSGYDEDLSEATERGWKPLRAGETIPIVRRDDTSALSEALHALELAAKKREKAW